MPATLSILNAVFPPKERPQAIAAWSAVTGIGIVIGPTLGGLLLTHFWWGSVFLINIPLVALALAGVILTVPRPPSRGSHRLDIPGTALIGGALFAIVDAIIEAPSRGWTGTATLAETRRRAGRARRLRLVGAAHRAPARRPENLRLTGLLHRRRIGDRHLLRPVRQPVRADPVPAAGARLQPAVRRAARAAVRPGHRRHLAAVTDPGQPLRHPPGDPGRHGADGHRPARPVHRGRAHRLSADRPRRRDHGRRHGTGDGTGQHHHHDHRARRRPAPAAPSTTPSGKSAAPSASRSSAASPPPSTARGSPMCSPRGTRPPDRPHRDRLGSPPPMPPPRPAARRAANW